jgi:hypothetical protein
MKINTVTTFAFITLVFAILAGYLIKDAYAVTCFKQYERISGMNKICVYNCLGSDRAITIKSFNMIKENLLKIKMELLK